MRVEQKSSLLKVKQHSPNAEIDPINSRIKVESRGRRGNSREKKGEDIKIYRTLSESQTECGRHLTETRIL